MVVLNRQINSLKLSDERQRLLDWVTEIVTTDEYDNLLVSVVIDTALTHLMQITAEHR